MSQPEVTIEQGRLRGSIATNIQGENYFSFQGIPYAKPPLGDFRFKAPVPPEKWSGIFDATKEGDPCYARDLFKQENFLGSENCLVLNVYTKKLPSDKKSELKPVLFWIHGGGFIFGHGGTDLYGPDLLITEDVVVVTINYRLGLLGFLSFEDSSLGVPGNAGFKDMVMALKWVQKNIAHFGGDPQNVTIFGESAGGASVHLLVLSPMTKGLFHKAIAQSGCALNPWAKGTKSNKHFATILQLQSADDRTIYNNLMSKSVEELFEVQEKLVDNLVASELRPIGYVVESKSNEPAFLTQEPIEIILSGNFNQVPLIMGYTTREGMCFELFKRPDAPKIPKFENMIPWSFGYQPGNSNEIAKVGESIKQFYYGSEEPDLAPVDKKYIMLGDVMFLYGIYHTIVNQFGRSKAPIYLYRMSIDTELNFFKQVLKITDPGVSHADDMGYLFTHFATPKIKPGSLEEISYKRFVKLWTNFAKYGNPTPVEDPLLSVKWKPVQGEELDFIDIGKHLIAGSTPDKERIDFWKKLFANSPAGQKNQCAYIKRTK